MVVTIVHVYVKPQYIDDFIAATRTNHEASIQETGNRRFDILQQDDPPDKFVLYEAYVSQADAFAHKKTPHYLRWRKTVAHWMAKPREGVSYQGLYPNADGDV
ncbi:MAG: antibiotic biosynthesis monooxygenase [Gammaproteobacteria bacterium]|nr:antibiotic biosynthesis monooxygenase [Gammaproteobacteria bacterium]